MISCIIYANNGLPVTNISKSYPSKSRNTRKAEVGGIDCFLQEVYEAEVNRSTVVNVPLSVRSAGL